MRKRWWGGKSGEGLTGQYDSLDREKRELDQDSNNRNERRTFDWRLSESGVHGLQGTRSEVSIFLRLRQLQVAHCPQKGWLNALTDKGEKRRERAPRTPGSGCRSSIGADWSIRSVLRREQR